MISTTHATANVNPQLAGLQSLIKGNQTSLDWLIVAHDDPVILHRLSDAIDESGSAVLPIPQRDWDFDGEKIPQVIRWAIQETGVKHLLVLGHSDAGPAEHAAGWIGESSEAESQAEPAGSGVNRLLEGARRVQRQAIQSKSHFQSQVEHLLALEDVQEAVSLGKLNVYALFYLAQGGMFLKYDPAQQAFDPIAK